MPVDAAVAFQRQFTRTVRRKRSRGWASLPFFEKGQDLTKCEGMGAVSSKMAKRSLAVGRSRSLGKAFHAHGSPVRQGGVVDAVGVGQESAPDQRDWARGCLPHPASAAKAGRRSSRQRGSSTTGLPSASKSTRQRSLAISSRCPTVRCVLRSKPRISRATGKREQVGFTIVLLHGFAIGFARGLHPAWRNRQGLPAPARRFRQRWRSRQSDLRRRGCPRHCCAQSGSRLRRGGW